MIDMKHLFILVVVGVLALPASAQGPQVVVDFGGTPQALTLTVEQVADLDAALAYVNTSSFGRRALTKEQWITEKIEDILRYEIRRARLRESVTACEEYRRATNDDRKAIIARLGGNRPCQP